MLNRSDGDKHLCLSGSMVFRLGRFESLGDAAIQVQHASTLADGDAPLSNGEDTDAECFSGL